MIQSLSVWCSNETLVTTVLGNTSEFILYLPKIEDKNHNIVLLVTEYNCQGPEATGPPEYRSYSSEIYLHRRTCTSA